MSGVAVSGVGSRGAQGALRRAARNSAGRRPAAAAISRSFRRHRTVRVRAVSEDGTEDAEELAAIESRLGLGRRGKREGRESAGAFVPPPAAAAEPVDRSAWDIWAGEKGVLFWLNEIAWKGSISLIIAWIIFRFGLPALGLYTLSG
mmetsp:Transcript_28614/g.93479  ORF Transcript_28614/g.93479 Transcript_28614/m.93479 type:complete len:147 (+) Transcript_28614:1773-2213(+)